MNNHTTTADFTCVLGTPKKQTEKGHRIVQFTDHEGKEIRVVTNLMAITAEEIAGIYKSRWVILATEKDIWGGITSKSKGTKILSLDHMIETIDYSINNQIAVISNGKIYYTANQGESWEQATVPKPFYVVQISDNGDLVGLTEEREIFHKTKNGWNEITMPNSNNEPLDMKVINNRLFITTQNGIWIRELQDGNWRKIQVDEVVVKFIKKGEKLFGYSNRGEAIYSINTKDERKPEKVFNAIDFNVLDVDIMGNTLWIATIPNYSWEEMMIQQRG